MTRSRVRAVARPRRLAFALAALAGVAALLVAVFVFPYHSTNHDEAVYLQQAAMLLDGRLFLRPPVEGSFRPWFFVRAGGASASASGGGPALYPKYAPVPAAVFALGAALGGYRLALPLVAAAVVGLTYGVTSETFDRRTGVLAALLLAASPLFLVQSGLFLPYAPTAALNLAFAFAYLRADRTGRRRDAALAGVAVGLAFFARPYTAVLFAAPFVAHALWTLRGGDGRESALTRHATTAAFGLCGVALALGYNAAVTGSPSTFPYEAFAPRDGLGFGKRALLGYERTYTPSLALRANARVLAELFGEWVVAGPLGTALAAGGLAAVSVRRGWDARRAALAGVFVSVVAGNVYFWGNLNVLGALGVPDDGLVEYYGPYYHYDLLVPTAAFAAHGARAGRAALARRARERFDPDAARRVVIATLLVSTAAFGGTAAVAASEPLRENAAVSDQLEEAYRPFEGREFDDALVFLPTPYGDWLNHPLQSLRNDPGFDGDAVYAVRENQFEVVDAYPNRTLYRYGYRGQWSPLFGPPVDARLQRVRVAAGERVALDAGLGVPPGAERVSVRVATDRGHAYYAATNPGETMDVRLVADGGVRLAGEAEPTGSGNASVPLAPRDTVRVTAFVDYGSGSGFSYRLEMPVERSNGTVRALTPYAEVCADPRRCGGEAMYVPRESRPGVSVSTRFVGGAAATAGGNETAMESH